MVGWWDCDCDGVARGHMSTVTGRVVTLPVTVDVIVATAPRAAG